MATANKEANDLPKRGTASNAPASLGSHIRQLRLARRWNLSELAERTGIAMSTLSKVENDALSLSYDRLIKVAEGFDLSLSEFLAEPENNVQPLPTGRISWARKGSGEKVSIETYDYNYLCTNLRQKNMVPMLVNVKARSLEEFGDLIRHEGEEFIFVVSGKIEVHTELYAPETLNAGEGVYIDSRQGHAFITVSKEDAVILAVNDNPGVRAQ